MFGLDTVLTDLAIAIAKPIVTFTETEVDDKILEVIDLITQGEYIKAMAKLSELVDPDEL